MKYNFILAPTTADGDTFLTSENTGKTKIDRADMTLNDEALDGKVLALSKGDKVYLLKNDTTTGTLEYTGNDTDDRRTYTYNNTAGDASISCTKLYEALGAKRENILMLDSKGVITSDRPNLTEQKKYFATDRRDVHTLEEAVKGADVFVGLSKGNVLTKDMVRSMADQPIVFALANPVPEISYEDAMDSRPDVLMSTGRSDYPNQINNVIGFPYIFRGALDVHATAINEEMKLAAVHAIADLAKQPVPDVVNDVYHVNNLTFGRDYFIPKPVDPRLITEVSAAVAKAAIESGVAREEIKDWAAYKNRLRELLGQETKLTQKLYDTARTLCNIFFYNFMLCIFFLNIVF